jgi:hypothetical protein
MSVEWKFIPDEDAPDDVRELAQEIFAAIDDIGVGHDANEVLTATLRALLDVVTKVAEVTEETESQILLAAAAYFTAQEQMCRACEEYPEAMETRQ